MTKDPAYLFYPADASEDTQFMNRLERGCYFDLMKAHKKFSRYTIETIKKVLGRDFEACWPAIESILKKDNAGYFIEWVDNSIERRKEFSKAQSDRITKYHNDKRENAKNDTGVPTTVVPNLYQTTTDDLPIVIENENEIEIVNEIGIGNEGVQGEKGERQFFSYLPLPELKAIVLADTNFVEPFWRMGVQETLPGWLDAFAKWLLFTGEQIKQERDYRTHFRHWLPKIPYTKMKPEDYEPTKDLWNSNNQQNGHKNSNRTPATGIIPGDKKFNTKL